jgi:signal transduction histidine kinase
VSTLERIRANARPLCIGAAFVAVYVLADPATNLFPHPRFGVQPWIPRPALSVGLIALGGARYVPAVLLGVLGGWWLANGLLPGIESLVIALMMTAVFWAAGAALRRWTHWCDRDVRTRDVHILLFVALGAALAGAALDASRQMLASDLTPSSMPLLSWRWFVANLLGLAVLLPALTQWAAGGRFRQALSRVDASVVRDAALFLLSMGALLVLVFAFRPFDEFRMSYLLFLPMMMLALRYGVWGASMAIPVAQLGLLGALATVGTRPGTAFEFQLLMLTLTATSLYLGALSDERQRATQRIRVHERALRERSNALAQALRIASTAELAAAMAHDLSQPLSAMGTYARAGQVLASRNARGMAAEDHAQLIDTLDQIVRESARAGQYLRRMREFFRTGTMREERVEVGHLFDAVHALLRDRLAIAEIQWQITVAPVLPLLCVDEVQIEAVLGNLVANACDALAGLPRLRSIHLEAFVLPGSEGKRVRIVVEDSGPGIAPALRERLFTPLATDKPHGMGLGLALSRSIVERQGGQLWFDSASERTRFCLDLRAHV